LAIKPIHSNAFKDSSNNVKGARGERFFRNQLKHYILDAHNVQEPGADIHGFKQNKEIVGEVMNWKHGFVNNYRFFHEIVPNLLSNPKAKKIIFMAGAHLTHPLRLLAEAYGFIVIQVPSETYVDQWPALTRKALAKAGVIDCSSREDCSSEEVLQLLNSIKISVSLEECEPYYSADFLASPSTSNHNVLGHHRHRISEAIKQRNIWREYRQLKKELPF
jgi:hypothetical protein